MAARDFNELTKNDYDTLVKTMYQLQIALTAEKTGRAIDAKNFQKALETSRAEIDGLQSRLEMYRPEMHGLQCRLATESNERNVEAQINKNIIEQLQLTLHRVRAEFFAERAARAEYAEKVFAQLNSELNNLRSELDAEKSGRAEDAAKHKDAMEQATATPRWFTLSKDGDKIIIAKSKLRALRSKLAAEKDGRIEDSKKHREMEEQLKTTLEKLMCSETQVETLTKVNLELQRDLEKQATDLSAATATLEECNEKLDTIKLENKALQAKMEITTAENCQLRDRVPLLEAKIARFEANAADLTRNLEEGVVYLDESDSDESIIVIDDQPVSEQPKKSRKRKIDAVGSSCPKRRFLEEFEKATLAETAKLREELEKNLAQIMQRRCDCDQCNL